MPFFYKLDDEVEGDRRTARRLLLLREQLSTLPDRTVAETLMLATWNLRDFDATKYGLRSDEAIAYIAEIISRFDLVAVQEVNADLGGLERLMRVLGPWWSYLLTDVTSGTAGNRERMAFIYDGRKVKFGGLSGEVVIPPKKVGRRTYEPADQLARTPFLCGFKAGWLKFMLCTVHVYYGTATRDDPKRIREIQLLSKFLAKLVTGKHAWASNIALLGDFNIFAPGDATFNAITDAGFFIPEQIQSLPSNVPQNKHYDQMAFMSRTYDQRVVRKRLREFRAGVIDVFSTVYRDEDEALYKEQMGRAYRVSSKGKRRDAAGRRRYYRQWRTHQMSDHLPMWIELAVDFGGEYLETVAGAAAASAAAKNGAESR